MGCAICVRSHSKLSPEDPQPKAPLGDLAREIAADTQRTAPNDGGLHTDPVPNDPPPINSTEDAAVSSIPAHFLQNSPHNHIFPPTGGQ